MLSPWRMRLWLLLPLSALAQAHIGTNTCPARPQPTPGTCPASHFLLFADSNGWSTRGPCHAHGAEYSCIFTHPTFHSGLGLSLITTEPLFHELHASAPALSPENDASQQVKSPWGNAAAAPPFHLEAIPGKGLGLVAARRIPAGELFMARTPAVMVDYPSFTALSEAQLTELLVAAVGALPEGHRVQYLNLTTHASVDSRERGIYQVFAKNNYRTKIANVTDFHAVFADVSRLNHACRPNCGYQFDAKTLSQKVYAARDIEPGEELTVSYVDPIQPRETRRQQLQTSWGFKCACSQCTAADDNSHATTESDKRVRRILALWKELDDYTPTGAGTPEKAQELVDLYEQEDLGTRIHEAYYRAAVEWNGAGDSGQAARFAMMSILRGQIMAGPERPFVVQMRELIRGPEEHWTWRFRLREDGGEAE